MRFDNEVQFGEFCNANGITHNFSAPRTPQSNGVVERKNRTLQEMSRTMLNEQSLPQKFWCNAVDTSTYILNRILIRAILGKTPYELLRGRKPTLDYFRVFGSKCFILNTKDYLTKFDPKSYEGVFLVRTLSHDKVPSVDNIADIHAKPLNVKVTMPRATSLDHQKTRNYIPLISNEFNQPLRNTIANLEKRYFHEGRVVSPNLKNMSHTRAKFESIGFDCLLDINEQIIPRFVLEFYCQLTFDYNPEGQFIVNFVIQNKSFSLTLEEFGQILKIPFKGQASNTEMWSLDHLSVSVPSRGLYKTKPPSPRVIKSFIQVPRQGQETRTKNKKTSCEDIGSCLQLILSHAFIALITSTSSNLAYFILLKNGKDARFKPKRLLPYGIALD
ncbi:retrovirus-related pol polyprotein from transposon TNT 1-94 [Tanacetum coccineum]|uniref:Retrovirus-related pol polyprotein from transposon TNT 1-94 n=1 Tax=Tanacetum coccineum TaxID=301880 RepID=A0ABQ5I125_9ASTR